MNFLKIQKRLGELRTHAYTRLIRGSFGSMGRDCAVLMSIRCSNPKDIHIGNRVFIGADAWIDCIKQYGDQTFMPRLEIGDGTQIGHHSHIMVIGHMTIGKGVMMANKVYVSDNLHGYEDVTRSCIDQPLVHRPVEIGDEVWLGENVSVLPGVKIGRHSVIGANSVVSRDIPDYCVAVGAPATVIRRYDGSKWNRETDPETSAVRRSVMQLREQLPVMRAVPVPAVAASR